MKAPYCKPSGNNRLTLWCSNKSSESKSWQFLSMPTSSLYLTSNSNWITQSSSLHLKIISITVAILDKSFCPISNSKESWEFWEKAGVTVSLVMTKNRLTLIVKIGIISKLWCKARLCFNDLGDKASDETFLCFFEDWELLDEDDGSNTDELHENLKSEALSLNFTIGSLETWDWKYKDRVVKCNFPDSLC